MADQPETLSRLYELIGPFTKSQVEFNAQTDLIDELGLDSMKVMDLVMQIEDEFDVSVPLNVLADVRTIGDLAKQLQRLLNEV